MSADFTKEYPFEIKNVIAQEAALLAEIFEYKEYFRFGSKGYVGHDGIRDEAILIHNMEIRPSDVIVVAHPRSGTTWTQEIIWMLANDLDYEKSKSINMLKRFPFIECSSLIPTELKNDLLEMHRNNQQKLEIVKEITKCQKDYLDRAESPRFMKTHFPLSLLPTKMLETAKVVYVARDPRDVAVSQYHLYEMAFVIRDRDFKKFWKAFMNDLMMYTPFFEHLKEAWEMRHHPNMLFLFYEDLTKDLSGTIRRVADFLGKSIAEADLRRLCEHLSFDNFKKNDTFAPGSFEEIGAITDSKQFIRRGKAGGWRDYFDAEMTERAELWIAENLRGTDLRFPVIEDN